ncbi:hypothetical protein D7B24_009012 [Verticillium nonalfalfae]|uniref:Uncharacterized protein n=1 Tax=Verticillium nonalfalfae TaxID=1051616 RepID=A0A3M9Y3R0_9PEZI|nr:uncharacterized protein D7B24_009012 [Verticillium nonalfalfae]RNJ55067.1 hypothetical protein D7B24_009012 [Verticillium nonalfalfae]
MAQPLDPPPGKLAVRMGDDKGAVERSSVPLSVDWLNNATARMPGVVENIDSLVEAAVAQDPVAFRQPGLKVVAAPWAYAFIKKVSRITQGTGRQYDASDAVAYLHQFIATSNRGRPVKLPTVQGWGQRYKALSLSGGDASANQRPVSPDLRDRRHSASKPW